MINCNDLVHPFQHDPGVSQRQRVMNELLTGAPAIDGHTMADLLNYFVQLAPEINYYDRNLQVSDWTPFFKESTPFLLASITRAKTDVISEKFDLYDSLSRKNPSRAGLQLNISYTYYHTFQKINSWSTQLKGSGLPIENFIARLITNRLKPAFLSFVSIANTANRYYCVKKPDFSGILQNEAWSLQQQDLYATDTDFMAINSDRGRLLSLQKELADLFPSVLEGMKTLPIAAEKDLPASLIPTDPDLQKKHEPHLALIYVFLNMFQKLQGDLNGFTRKHLDFFYQDILQLKPQGATPDKANILLQLQNQVQKYLVKKGTLVKDGKDLNKTEILYATDDEIVVNKTQVTDIRTLFVNNQVVHDKFYIEGVYMAPNAPMANGVDKPFKDDQPANYPTLGGKNSKYIGAGKDDYQPYPNARLGLILASPVLLLNEGKRTVTITLACKIVDSCGQTPPPPPVVTSDLYDALTSVLSKTFIVVTEDQLQAAIAKGIKETVTDAIRQQYLVDHCKVSICGNNRVFYKKHAQVEWNAAFWTPFTTDAGAQKILSDVFPQRKGISVQFSGDKEWIAPAFDKTPADLVITAGALVGGAFTITVNAILWQDKPAVTFYNKKNLVEDIDTTQPVARLLLDGDIRIPLDLPLQGKLGLSDAAGDCCLDKKADLCDKEISLYNFFRNVTIEDTAIKVQVCGMKQIIVQNDDSVQDVNSPVYPFGTIPKLNANFFIGSEEVFLKRWSDVWVNAYWKDIPPEGFANYYNGYQNEYRDKNGVIIKKVDEVGDANFMVESSFLQDGKWYTRPGVNTCDADNTKYDPLFTASPHLDCFNNKGTDFSNLFTHQYYFKHDDFTLDLPTEAMSYKGIKRMDAGTRQFFLRMSLKCQDFQHAKYPIVLGRQLTAAAKLPDLTDSAVYYNINSAGDVKKVDVKALFKDIVDSADDADVVKPKLENLLNQLIPQMNGGNVINIDNTSWQAIFGMDSPGPIPNLNTINQSDLFNRFLALYDRLRADRDLVNGFQAKGAVIPNEPWNPIISNISLDYIADATMADIDLIHLYPYTGTYKHEEIRLKPALFPTFCDEGTLFLGLKDLVPGENLNILFQLAEATSDSESDPQDVYWYYLFNNAWKPLRNKFEVLDDGTDNLTTSGIIKFALPDNISADNTVMPKGLYWIKAGVPRNSGDVSETIGIHPQAVSVTFTNDEANDRLRLDKPLSAGSVARLATADASIKEVSQPYDTFGGAVPELQSQYYVRVSELLRHKGRAIQKFDYERIVLQAFPQIFKAKCINHSFALNAHAYKNDFPFAPGYVLMAVIPDLTKLKAGASFQPKAPVSLLEKIQDHVKSRTSPFVRFRVMNPRYEAVHFCITVKLLPGKDPVFYKQQLADDIERFMAPWAVGDYYKLSFGQCISRSDVIQFLETRDYVDYIQQLKMLREDDLQNPCDEPMQICPATPRSILIAGDVDVTLLPDTACQQWGEGQCNAPILLNDYCKKK